jgi:hypothetical protein
MNQSTRPGTGIANRLTHHAPMFVALAVATVVISRNYCSFLANPRPLWNGLVHDRNGHYEFAVELALALRQRQPIRFLSILLDQSKVWPPMHGLLTALLIAPGGPDYRWAVIPSLLGWWVTAAFAFLTAKKISSAGGSAAGLVAVGLVLASPAYRAYGTDIMLESLGAGLTMMALYMYIVASQEGSARAWRNLAIVMTLLFFEKYSYWMLVVLALGGNEILRHPGHCLTTARSSLGRVNRQMVVGEMSHPLNLIALTMLVLMAAAWIRGPQPLSLARYRISVYPPRNLLTAAYVALALRVAFSAPAGWWQRLFSSSGVQSPRSELFRWHVLPVSASFLMPGRLWMFLWHVGPSNYDHTNGIRWAITYYTGAAVYEYHPSPWTAWVVAGGLVLALAGWRNWRCGGVAVVLLAIIGGAAVILHPNQQSRFLFSWFAAVWVAAAGATISGIYSRRLAIPPGISAPISWIVAIVAFVILIGYAAAPRPVPPPLSDLDLSDAYLPALGGFRRVVFLSNMPIGPFVNWTFMQCYQRPDAILWPLKGADFSPKEGARWFAKLAAASTAKDALVFIDVPPESPDYVPLSEYPQWAKLLEAMRSDPHLRLSTTWEVPGDRAKITLWAPARYARENAQPVR